MRILYGPTDPRKNTDGLILQAIRRDHQIMTFGEEQADIPYIYEEASFADILKRIAFRQEPEIVLFCEPELRAIPASLEACPCISGAVIFDWRSRFSVLREISGYFDFLILSGEGAEALKRTGAMPLLLAGGNEISGAAAIDETFLRDCLQEGYARLHSGLQPSSRIIYTVSETDRKRIRASQALLSPDAARFLVAEKELRAAQAIAPQNALIRNNLGVLYAAYAAASAESGRRERFRNQAMRQLEAARQFMPCHAVAEANRARLLAEMNLSEEGEQSLRQAIELLRQDMPEPFAESLYFPLDDLLFRQAFEESAVLLADQPEAFGNQIRQILIKRLETLYSEMAAHQVSPPNVPAASGSHPAVEGMREINFLYQPVTPWEEAGWQAVLRVYTDIFAARDPVALVIDPHRGSPYSEEKLNSIAGDIHSFLIQAGRPPLRVADILLLDEETARSYAQPIEAGCQAMVAMRGDLIAPGSLLPLLQSDSEEELARVWRRFALEVRDLSRGPLPRRKYALTSLPDDRGFLSLDAGAFSNCRRVLDARCGEGYFLEILSERSIGAEGVETDREMAAFCRSRGFRIFESLQNVSGPYDGIRAAYILERMAGEEAVRYLEECVRLLAPGGILLVRTVNCDSPVYRDVAFWLDYGHVRPYPLPLLNRIFEDLELAVVFSETDDGDSRIAGRKA